MATRTWDDGAADGVFITAANWSADTAPVDTDTAIIATSNRAIAAADNSGIELAAFRILNGWTGRTIGSESSPLKIDATELEVINRSMSYLNLEGIYPTVYARQLGSGTLRFGAASDIGTIYAGTSGSIYVDTAAKLAAFYSAGCNATIMGDTSTPDDLELYIPQGCVVNCYRRVAKAMVAGTLNLLGAAEGDISAGTSQIVIASTGIVNVESTGNYDDFVAMPRARLVGGKQVGGSTKPTIAKVVLSDGAKVSLSAALFTVTSEVYTGGVEDVGPG